MATGSTSRPGRRCGSRRAPRWRSTSSGTPAARVAMAELSHDEYVRRYGPTTGDRIRLGDTDLWVRVEDDRVGYGDEPMWGYAKNIRSRMTQFDRATGDSELDMLIAGVVVIDARLGVVKTNIGIR